MNLRPVPNPAPYIFSILALGEVQDRLAAERAADLGWWLPPSMRASPRFPDLSPSELAEARRLAGSYRYTLLEAAEIVRRSRRP